MQEHGSIDLVRAMIAEHVASPAPRHIRDPEMVWRLAKRIVERLGASRDSWRKWDDAREALLRAAACCWIPLEDMREYLNGMAGPALTSTDVAQRLRAIHEERYEPYPNDALQEACLALYEREKDQGTELPAIVGAVQEFVEREEERLQRELQERLRTAREEERLALERRFASGADCKWTPVGESQDFYCRMNGRVYRLSARADRTWAVHRIAAIDDAGTLVGTYGQRRDATKALAVVAYEPEPW
jgi:hypothetical protein